MLSRAVSRVAARNLSGGVSNQAFESLWVFIDKYWSKFLAHLDNTLTTLDLQKEALENSSFNAKMIETMKTGNKAMKTAMGNISVDDIDRIKDDMDDQLEIHQELMEAMGRPAADQDMFDEDELEAELDSMWQEEVDSNLLSIPGNTTSISTSNLPSVPASTPKAPQKESHDDELAEMNSWLSA